MWNFLLDPLRVHILTSGRRVRLARTTSDFPSCSFSSRYFLWFLSAKPVPEQMNSNSSYFGLFVSGIPPLVSGIFLTRLAKLRKRKCQKWLYWQSHFTPFFLSLLIRGVICMNSSLSSLLSNSYSFQKWKLRKQYKGFFFFWPGICFSEVMAYLYWELSIVGWWEMTYGGNPRCFVCF